MAKQKTSTNKYHHKKKKRDIMPTKRLFEAGERKVLRRNIVLSNTNAPVLPLPEMMLDICGIEETEGTVFQIPDSVLDNLKALGAFKTGQHWPYFRRPSTLVRKGSVEIGKLISWINEGEVTEGDIVKEVAAKGAVAKGEVAEGDIAEVEVAKEEAVGGEVAGGEVAEGDIVEAGAAKGEVANGGERYATRILDGIRGSGKSILLAQAMNWAIQSKWVVISIPNGMPYVPSVAQFNYKFSEGLVLLYSAGSCIRPHRIRIRSRMGSMGTKRVHRGALDANIEGQRCRPFTGPYISSFAPGAK